MCQNGYPILGIQIFDYIFEQFPQEVKDAWATFDEWWHKQDKILVSRTSMPENVANAFEIMKKAPIPGYDEAYGLDSCYVIGVESNLVD